MEKEKLNLPKDYYEQASEVLGEDFWQDIGQLIPVTGPRIDMYHTSSAVVVLAELPGLQTRDQIEIQLEGQYLLLKGEIPCPYPVTDNRILLKERYFGPFQRSLALPRPVSESGIVAKYSRGLLVIELPIEQSAPQTNIPIQY
ncbi:Hsp20/alpha crystallin family protein [Cohnella nanjingensis]|uniref:Hsp20/alpha crystallin family protein n=1 Tax=Cohnella nanjingensis TaxID=1387779 RepID=A0A7X0VDI9_9BACL|nr:Hsp20/alpha crystallin family protein [Cohnella nanjingensis]MBB6669248.1 Hsp20/alpha crystallin family protein [Cohnella nanjingensis]